MRNPVYCAVDTQSISTAIQIASQLKDKVGGFKLGLEYFMAHGVEGYKHIAAFGTPIFLDVKLHDIPNTVAGAVKSLLPLNPEFITIHTSGGGAMMAAAAKAAASNGAKRPKL